MTAKHQEHGADLEDVLGEWLAQIHRFSDTDLQPDAQTEAQLAAVVRGLEDLKNAAAAAQAGAARRLDALTRSRESADGVPGFRQGRGVASENAFARRISPHRSRILMQLAKLLPEELPCTWAAFRSGVATEEMALAMAKATACLSLPDRLRVDREVAGDSGVFERMSLKEVEAAAAKWAAKLDPASVVRRRRIAEGERRVTVTPAPDTMSRLTLLVPVAQGVAAFAALKRYADRLHGVAESGGRSRSQLMADRGIELLTGQVKAEHTPVRLNLVMTDASLFGADDAQMATLVEKGLGSLRMTGAAARRLVVANLMAQATNGVDTWLRRLYRHPESGQLISMDASTRKGAPGARDLHHPSRPDLSKSVVRCAHTTPRPHHAGRGGWCHDRRQPARALRSMQPRQTGSRMETDRRPSSRRHPRGRDRHACRPTLSESTTTCCASYCCLPELDRRPVGALGRHAGVVRCSQDHPRRPGRCCRLGRRVPFDERR